MQQCLCTAAVFFCAPNLAASLPAIAGITSTHHRDSRPGIHPTGHLVAAFQAKHRGTIETLVVLHNLPASRSTDLQPPEPLCVADMAWRNPGVFANIGAKWLNRSRPGKSGDIQVDVVPIFPTKRE